jgi:hypothetical protein
MGMKAKKSSSDLPLRSSSSNPSRQTPAARPTDRVSHGTIAERAYTIWLDHGQPSGRELEHWLEAERQLGTPESSFEHRASHTSATVREIDSDEFTDRVEDAMDEVASPSRQRSATSLDV